MNSASEPLKVVPVAQVEPTACDQPTWLIEKLWASQAVGVIGGAPKCCKSWLALEMALSVASGRPCLGQFEAMESGPVLVYAAEDAPRQVRARLEGLAHARGAEFSDLAVHLILEARLRLDEADDQERLAAALDKHRPKLLILDPFVRLHRIDENSAAEVSALLADLRRWQREFGVAIVLVHHTRKSSEANGQTLRGSSDLHAWGDSNLYVRRSGEDLVLSSEHRWARSGEPLTLRLIDADGPPRLEIVEVTQEEPARPDLAAQVLAVLRSRSKPVPQEELRALLKVRNQRLTEVLWGLRADGKVDRGSGGWFVKAE